MKLKEIVLEHMVTELLEIVKYTLELDQLPKIVVLDEPTIPGQTSFGIFDSNSQSVVVAAQGRHPMDVLRTLAHELVHWKQKTLGYDLDGSDGSDTENEANAVAGQIMRTVGRLHPEYFLQSL